MYFMSSSFRVVTEVMGVYIYNINVLLQNQRQAREVKPSRVHDSQQSRQIPLDSVYNIEKNK